MQNVHKTKAQKHSKHIKTISETLKYGKRFTMILALITYQAFDQWYLSLLHSHYNLV